MMSLRLVLVLLSIVLAKRRMQRVPVRAYLPVPYPGGAKKEKSIAGDV
jgi:hypothetical protein